jgi:TIR domain-containing protein
VADIFVSYTSNDRDWAFWIGQELLKLGHAPRIHEWEIKGEGDSFAWMEERLNCADHIILVVSEAYLKAPFSSWERRAAEWVAISKRPNFALPVFIDPCEAPTLLAVLKRCDLHGLKEDEARKRLQAFLAFSGNASLPMPFPQVAETDGEPRSRDGAPLARFDHNNAFNRKTLPEDADFFISRAGGDSIIGLEICSALEDSGYRCLIQDRDFGSQNFMSAMNGALKSRARVVALLSDAYQQSPHCEHEWTSVIASDPQNKRERLIVFRIGDCAPTGSLSGIPYLDLVPHLNDKRGLRQKILEHARAAESLGKHGLTSEQGNYVEMLFQLKEWRENGLINDEVAMEYQRIIVSDALNIPVRR